MTIHAFGVVCSFYRRGQRSNKTDKINVFVCTYLQLFRTKCYIISAATHVYTYYIGKISYVTTHFHRNVIAELYYGCNESFQPGYPKPLIFPSNKCNKEFVWARLSKLVHPKEFEHFHWFRLVIHHHGTEKSSR